MTHGVIASAVKQSRSSSTAFAALAGFFLPWQTVWILRPGMLGGVPWPLATIGLYASDVVLLVAAVIGLVRLLRSTPPSPPSEGGGETNKFSPLPDGRGSGRGWGSRRLPIAFGLLISLATVNTAASVDPWLSAVGWVRIIAFLLAFAGLPYSERATRAFLGGFLVAMLGHVALGFWQFATGHGFASTLLGTAAHDAFVRGDSVLETLDGRWLRAYGGFPHPNVFGVALLAALAALVRWSLASPPSPPSREGGKQKNISPLPAGSGSERGWASFIIHHSSFIILIFSLIMTFSRAAWIGLPIFFIVLSVRRATRSLAIVGTVAAIAIGVALWPLIAPRVTGDGRNELRSIAERRSGIRDALALSAIPPFLGVGLHAMPQTVYQSGRTFNPSFSPYDAQPVHDVPLLIAVEVGWFGIALFLLALMHLFPRGIAWRWEYLALAPPFLLDHSLWSLPVGLALAFIFAMSVSLDSVRSHE